jgi:hypothetical protein
MQNVEREAAPQLILVRFLAKRRAHHVLRAGEPGLFVVVVRQEEILRARLGTRRQAAVAGLGHHLEGVGR